MKDVQIVVNPQDEGCSFITNETSSSRGQENRGGQVLIKSDLKRVQGNMTALKDPLMKDFLEKLL